jgi:hypothetical protein
MKRMLLAAAAAIGLLGLAAAGDKPVHGVVTAGGCEGCGAAAHAAPAHAHGPAMPGFGGACPECERAKRFGVNPLLQRLAFWKKDTECGTCGIGGKLKGCVGGLCGNNCGGSNGGAGYGGFNPYPNGVPGTLVFPQHPYARSPRDWFEK